MPSRLTLQDLIDRAEISDVVIRYATGIDKRDWTLWKSIFEPEVLVNFKTWSGMEPATMKTEDWAARVATTLSGFDATEHVSANHVHTLAGDEATCVSYMMALHYLIVDGDRRMQAIGGYYTNKLRRGPDGWKIHACELTVNWEMGDRGLFDIARARVAARAK